MHHFYSDVYRRSCVVYIHMYERRIIFSTRGCFRGLQYGGEQPARGWATEGIRVWRCVFNLIGGMKEWDGILSLSVGLTVTIYIYKYTAMSSNVYICRCITYLYTYIETYKLAQCFIPLAISQSRLPAFDSHCFSIPRCVSQSTICFTTYKTRWYKNQYTYTIKHNTYNFFPFFLNSISKSNYPFVPRQIKYWLCFFK